MNIEQVRSAAETQLSYLSDPSCIRIHVGASSSNSNVVSIIRQFEAAIGQGKFQAKTVRTGSFGYYDLEPIVTVKRQSLKPVFYPNVTLDGIVGIADDLAKGAGSIPYLSELPSFNRQKRIALRNCGWIDPEDINSYIIQGQGYAGLAKALGMKPSGSEKIDKHLICNAVDPHPKTLTSRLLIESDPHSVLEGMAIQAFNIGASHCYILVEEKSEAVKKFQKALDQMRLYGLLGSKVLDVQFGLEIEIIEVPMQWTLGNRIELFRCIEEKQPLPHMLPTLPGISGIFAKPVAIVDPETMARISAMKDADGTKIVTLSGNAMQKCTVEVSNGTTIRSVIENYGCGVSNRPVIKAVQSGGPAGAFVSPDSLDVAMDSESIEVFEADSSIVDVTHGVIAYIQSQSCGKCVFCREGCLQMLTILEDISENKGKPHDLDLLLELGEEMRTGCLCSWGRSAPNPVLSSLKLFRSEFEERL